MSRREVRANRADAQESVHEVECFLCLRIKVLNHGAGELVRVILLEIDYLLEDIDIDRLLGEGAKGQQGARGTTADLQGEKRCRWPGHVFGRCRRRRRHCHRCRWGGLRWPVREELARVKVEED